MGSGKLAEASRIAGEVRRRNLDKIKILIADDHAVVREGTRKILEQEQDLEVIAEALNLLSPRSLAAFFSRACLMAA